MGQHFKRMALLQHSGVTCILSGGAGYRAKGHRYAGQECALVGKCVCRLNKPLAGGILGAACCRMVDDAGKAAVKQAQIMRHVGKITQRAGIMRHANRRQAISMGMGRSAINSDQRIDDMARCAISISC